MSEEPNNPIVIYGAARSGTTYLVHILNQHPQVHVSDETRVFAWAHEAIHGLTADQRLSYRKHDELVAHLKRALPETLRGFYRELAPAARWWGDKNPHYAAPENAGCLETIVELFPGARFLHIVRDGRDVVTSGLRGVWTQFERVHEMWTTHVDLGSAFGRALAADRYFELRYEELIADDAAMAERIFGFLGIDFHPQVARFCRHQQSRRTPFCTPSRDIADDVTRSDWASFLEPERQRRSLELLGEHLVRYGYETPQSLAALRERVSEAATVGAR